MGRLFQAMKRPSHAEYHLPLILWSWIVVSAPSLAQTKIFLRWVNIDLFFQVHSQESRSDIHLMDLEIVLGSESKCLPKLSQAGSRCIRSLVVDAFDLVIFSTDYPGLEALHIACPIALDIVYPMIVLATCPRNLPAVRVWATKTFRFGSRTIHQSDLLLLGSPNPAPYPSTRRSWPVCLDPSGPISGCVFQVFLFIVAFRYLTVNCNTLTMVLHCHFLMCWQPLYSKQVERRCLPHPVNECQLRVNNGWSYMLGNICGAWSHLSINKWLAAFIRNWANDIPAIASWRVTTYFIYKGATKCSRRF